MNLQELKKIISIRWNKFYIIKDATCYSDNNHFEIEPNDFLNFAKHEYNFLDRRGLVGALSNAKRAIDCQIDWIILYLGFDFLKFNDTKYSEVKSFIEEFENTHSSSKDLSMKLRFIQALGIAPTFLISKIRKVRHKLEHEYTLPTVGEAREAIEIAELFINATENILFNKFYTDYFIQNENDDRGYCVEPFIKISFESCSARNLKPYISITYREGEINEKLRINPEDKGYLFFIKAAVTNEFTYLINAFEYDIDKKYVRYEIDYA